MSVGLSQRRTNVDHQLKTLVSDVILTSVKPQIITVRVSSHRAIATAGVGARADIARVSFGRIILIFNSDIHTKLKPCSSLYLTELCETHSRFRSCYRSVWAELYASPFLIVNYESFIFTVLKAGNTFTDVDIGSRRL